MHLRIQTYFLLLLIALFPYSVFAADAVSEQHHQLHVTRVVALNWSSAEALLALGVVPVGIADSQGYSQWVRIPELPAGITDVGTRGEPNLELLRALKPELIISGPGMNTDMTSVSSIAPVLTLDTFRADHNNGMAIDRDFLTIAKAVGKEHTARQILRERDEKIHHWQQQLKQHFSGNLPPVTLVHFVNTSTAAVYGKNSSVEYALAQLGIQPAIATENTAWGETNLPLQRLASVRSGVLIYIRPFAEEKKLFSSILWKHMPFVQQHHFLVIDPSWTYGSALSIEYIAQATTQALLTLPQHQEQ